MKIYLAADHAGFQLKESLKPWLKNAGHEVFDEGAFVLTPEDDYPDFIKISAKMVAAEPGSVGIVFGKSGTGEAVVANREKGIRAVAYYGHNLDILKLSREHNNANVLSLAAGFLNIDEAKEAIEVWLAASFSGDDRHIRRIIKIDEANTDIFTV